MTHTALVFHLRQLLLTRGYPSEAALASVDEDAILAAYITRGCHGQRQVSGVRLAQAIAQAADVEDFLQGLAPLWAEHTPPLALQ
jgi:hypothetical protein